MNILKQIDKFIALKCYKHLLKYEAKSILAVGYVPEVVSKQLYNKRAKDWKNYGITLNDISKVVNEVAEVKPLHGIKLWVGLRKATLTIQTAIKQKRVVFTSEDRVEYTDRGYSRYKMTFDELAEKLIEKSRWGFKVEHITKILSDEYKRSKK